MSGPIDPIAHLRELAETATRSADMLAEQILAAAGNDFSFDEIARLDRKIRPSDGHR